MGVIRLLFPSCVALVFTITACTSAFAQDQQSSVPAAVRAEVVNLYTDAHPYLDGSIGQFKKAIPELRGLEPATGQEQLPGLLTNVGEKLKELVRKVPDLIASETVIEIVPRGQLGPLVLDPSGSDIFRPGTLANAQGQPGEKRTFNYIILVHQTKIDRTFEEYRTDRHDKTVQTSRGGPYCAGFASMWVAFSPANRDKSRFRYLGEQRIGRRRTFVLAYAELPSSAYPGTFNLPQGGSIPLLYQGIAWIDESDFRVLRLQTDLLAPQPQAGLQRLTARVHFGPVSISELPDQLWLPQEVNIDLEGSDVTVQEWHHYSKYRLFRAKARLLSVVP